MPRPLRTLIGIICWRYDPTDLLRRVRYLEPERLSSNSQLVSQSVSGTDLVGGLQALHTERLGIQKHQISWQVHEITCRDNVRSVATCGVLARKVDLHAQKHLYYLVLRGSLCIVIGSHEDRGLEHRLQLTVCTLCV